MSAETENKFIRILRFAYKHQTFTKAEIMKEFGLHEEEFSRYRGAPGRSVDDRGIYRQIAEQDHGGPESAKKFEITYTACMNYLEYVELEHSLKSSKQAKWIAIFAIIISSVLALGSIGIQLAVPTAVRIDDTQLQELKPTLVEQTKPQ